MKVIIYGDNQEAIDLAQRVRETLDELGLIDFIPLETASDSDFKNSMNITADSALVIEEDSIDFKDMIFEWLVPEHEELKSMFISVIGGGSTGGCNPWPGGCGDGCSC